MWKKNFKKKSFKRVFKKSSKRVLKILCNNINNSTVRILCHLDVSPGGKIEMQLINLHNSSSEQDFVHLYSSQIDMDALLFLSFTIMFLALGIQNVPSYSCLFVKADSLTFPSFPHNNYKDQRIFFNAEENSEH